MEVNPETYTMIVALCSKFKLYFYTVVTGFISGAIHYLQKKKNGEILLFINYIQFSVLASVITLTAMAFVMYIGLEINFIAYVIFFWAGMSQEYLFKAIPKLIKKYIGGINE